MAAEPGAVVVEQAAVIKLNPSLRRKLEIMNKYVILIIVILILVVLIFVLYPAITAQKTSTLIKSTTLPTGGGSSY